MPLSQQVQQLPQLARLAARSQALLAVATPLNNAPWHAPALTCCVVPCYTACCSCSAYFLPGVNRHELCTQFCHDASCCMLTYAGSQ